MPAPTVHLSSVGGSRTSEDEGTLHLTAMGPNVFATFPLPGAGSVTIGRDESAEVRITDEGAGRQHARLHVGPGAELFIEDLKTINGTFLRDSKIEPGTRVPLQPGEAVTIGYTILMVQRRRPREQVRRFRSHGAFEERLEDACERAAQTGATLAVVRVQVEDEEPAGRAADIIAPGLRAGDFLAQYAPGDYEVLLLDTESERARVLGDDLARRLRAEGFRDPKAVVAVYPGDGRSAEALIGRATALVRGNTTGKAPEPVQKSEGTRKLYAMAERAAAGRTATGLINILILGETGVGKEVLADWIHRHSPRAEGPYICINCAALSESLLESELFGHEKGAFTGAVAAKPGLLEAAAGGTVFLDEIGEMPLPLQTKLLRALENREITRVGGLKPLKIDVRFIAATLRDIEGEIETEKFRRDLYFRLNGISLTIPPLRERPGEIEPLARLFLAEAAKPEQGRHPPRLSSEALDILRAYCWPGNIRELRNIIERALVLCEGSEITVEHLPVEKMRLARVVSSPRAAAAPQAAPVPRKESGPVGVVLTEAQQVERARIIQVLDESAGSQTEAARKLGMSRGTLIARLNEYGIPRPRARRRE